MQGGITISKHHNYLKGNIIEGLQCIKYAICHDLFFHKLGPSSVKEHEEYKSEADPNKRVMRGGGGLGCIVFLKMRRDELVKSDFNL